MVGLCIDSHIFCIESCKEDEPKVVLKEQTSVYIYTVNEQIFMVTIIRGLIFVGINFRG